MGWGDKRRKQREAVTAVGSGNSRKRWQQRESNGSSNKTATRGQATRGRGSMVFGFGRRLTADEAPKQRRGYSNGAESGFVNGGEWTMVVVWSGVAATGTRTQREEKKREDEKEK
ncbi:hypothetical protein DEO72_LG5g932 [Vigna unguiculata]|uniref:Uncharacterized protein n=1 Tax=Vigna unguiculata TaxID=3917 RepID=A0A4D6LWL1_VIGUN|nr:hypothetical protein DEO72_LG5g932 [Vigna unguiculata]